MLKFFLKIIIIIISLGITTTIIISINSNSDLEDKLVSLSDFPINNLVFLDNSLFSYSETKSEKNLIIIYYNSTCQVCIEEIKQLNDKKKLEDLEFILVSNEPIDKIKAFIKPYDNLKDKDVLFLHDKNSFFSREMNINSIPQSFIFSKEKILIKKFKGLLTYKNLIYILNNPNI